MFISPAWAQAAEGAAPSTAMGDILAMLLPFILIFAVFYFLLILPNKKRMVEHRKMVEDLRRGDRIVTSGGVIGTVAKPPPETSNEVEVEIAKGVRVRILRHTILEKLDGTGKPANDAKKEAKKG